ncbi:MAG TPA: urease accessory protein UreD [Telluria sp.]|nr:urease accessory protein UreD [Telluria sp.]
MPDCSFHDAVSPAAWQASLRLGFADDAGTTRLVERAHSGPLRVQKALYPEGPAICHAIVLHPPGGVVGGDTLAIDVHAGPNAHAFLTTPGAAKWYRANGRQSRQRVRIAADAGAALEWMPQETIFFNDADVRIEHEVELGPGARYIGSEILCFGRRASGETFASGAIRQRTSIRLAGKLVWWEQGVLVAGGPAMVSPLGLGGASVCATLIAVGPPAPPALLAAMRARDERLALSQLKSVFVARYLCDDSEAARRAITQVWQALRPHLLGCDAVIPRIWTT